MLCAKLLFAVLLFLPGRLDAQITTSPSFSLNPLGNNVWAVIGDPSIGANAGFVIGDNGVLVVDTLHSPEAARDLLGEIRKITKLPIKFVINTGYRLDHVGGNAVFQDAGAVVLAQRNVRDWIRTENLKFFNKDLGLEQKTRIQQLSPPDVIYDNALELFLGQRRVQVIWRLGQSGGDSVITVSDSRIVFCGDLFWRKTLPNLSDASTGPWINTLEILARANPTGSFVPGHGMVGNANDLLEFRNYLSNLRRLVSVAQQQGKSGDVMAESVLPVLTHTYGTWSLFQSSAKNNILDVDAELRGKKTIPRPAEIE